MIFAEYSILANHCRIGATCRIGAAFSMIFAECSLFALPQMASDLFYLWGGARLRRVDCNRWELAPQLNVQRD